MTSNLEESLRLDTLSFEKQYWKDMAKAAKFESLYWELNYNNLKTKGVD